MRSIAKKTLSVFAALTIAASTNGITTFADVIPEDETEHVMGALKGIMLDEKGQEVIPDLMPDGEIEACAAATDSYFNLYDVGRVTSVKSQNPLGTCWAHAACAAAESSMITKGYADKTIDYSEGHLAWFGNGPGPTDTSDPLYGDAAKYDNAYDAYQSGGVIWDSIGAFSR